MINFKDITFQYDLITKQNVTLLISWISSSNVVFCRGAMTQTVTDVLFILIQGFMSDLYLTKADTVAMIQPEKKALHFNQTVLAALTARAD